jgi:hypothetical protein
LIPTKVIATLVDDVLLSVTVVLVRLDASAIVDLLDVVLSGDFDWVEESFFLLNFAPPVIGVIIALF